jgi:hypothetical protein
MSKYNNINKPKEIKVGQLRVWHIPQIPMSAFRVYVKNPKEARSILNVLAIYDLFQLENKIKPDYSNAQGLEVFEDGEWTEWEDEYGFDIDQTEEA